MNICKRCGQPFTPVLLGSIKQMSTHCETCGCRNILDGLGMPTPPELLDKHTLNPTLTEQEFQKELGKP